MTHRVFTSMSEAKLATLVAGAKHRIAVASPGLRSKSASAILDKHAVFREDQLSVIVDCQEETFRLGLGEFAAIEQLKAAGVRIRHAPGLRIGVLVVDEQAWIFAPTALYVQTEVHSDETPNAIQMRVKDVERILSGLGVPLTTNESPEQMSSPDTLPEIGLQTLAETTVEQTRAGLQVAPPLSFDVARQVRVFQAYIQYVEVRLVGAAIQRHRVKIPNSVQGIRVSSDVERRLRTTFDLIEQNSGISSKPLEQELHRIRDDFTRSLGKPWGRVILRAARPAFDERMAEFRERLGRFQQDVNERLSEELDSQLSKVVEYFFPLAKRNPPDALIAQIAGREPTDSVIRSWIRCQLEKQFPSVFDLLSEMRLEVTYRDVTYETLNESGFADALRSAYPHVDWGKPFDEFTAAKARD